MRRLDVERSPARILVPGYEIEWLHQNPRYPNLREETLFREANRRLPHLHSDDLVTKIVFSHGPHAPPTGRHLDPPGKIIAVSSDMKGVTDFHVDPEPGGDAEPEAFHVPGADTDMWVIAVTVLCRHRGGYGSLGK